MLNIIKEAKAGGRKVLTEIEAKEVLSAAEIPVVKTFLARSKEEAQQLASHLDFPLVIKLCSPDITHKTDAGGVILNITGKEGLGEAYDQVISTAKYSFPEANIEGVAIQEMISGGVEIISGTVKDPQFGPMVMFGLGGIFVEVLEDVSFRLTPLTAEDAWEMISEIKGQKILQGVRGIDPVKKESLVDVLLKLSHLVEETPDINEIDINPLFADHNGAVAADARIVLGID